MSGDDRKRAGIVEIEAPPGVEVFVVGQDSGRLRERVETEIADFVDGSLDVSDFRDTMMRDPALGLDLLRKHIADVVGDIRSGAYRKEQSE